MYLLGPFIMEQCLLESYNRACISTPRSKSSRFFFSFSSLLLIFSYVAQTDWRKVLMKWKLIRKRERTNKQYHFEAMRHKIECMFCFLRLHILFWLHISPKCDWHYPNKADVIDVEKKSHKNVALTFINGTFDVEKENEKQRPFELRNKHMHTDWIDMNYLMAGFCFFVCFFCVFVNFCCCRSLLITCVNFQSIYKLKLKHSLRNQLIHKT